MALFVLRKLILQTRMRSHPVGLDDWFLVGPFVYFHHGISLQSYMVRSNVTLEFLKFALTEQNIRTNEFGWWYDNIK